MPKNSSAARRAEIRRLAATDDISYTAALRQIEAEPHHYFVALTTHGFGRYGNGATVRDIRTGRVSALVPPPAGQQFETVTAAAEPGLFYLATSSADADRQAYRLQVNAHGEIADLSHLPALLDNVNRDIAVSPDGTQLAAVTRSSDQESARLCLISLPDGTRHHLRTAEPGAPGALSWAADGRTLAFAWHYDYEPDRTRVRVLNTQTARDTFADSHPVPEISPDLGHWVSPLLSADASHIFVTVAQPEPQGGPHWNRLLAIPVAGGQTRTLLERRYEPVGHNGIYLWTEVTRDAAGPALLLVYGGYAYSLDPATGESTRVPFSEGQPHTIAW